VYIVVNGSDLFDVYLTDNKGKIKESLIDVYVEDLINTIDQRVEYIDAYKF